MNSEQDAIKYITNNLYWDYDRIPVEFRTDRVNEHALQKKWSSLRQMSSEHITPELILAAFEHHDLPFSVLPDFLKNKAICDAAIRRDPRNIEFIPSSQITQEQAITVLQMDFGMIRYIPGELHSQALWDLAAQNVIFRLKDVPTAFKKRSLCMKFALHSYVNLKYVPQYVLDSEFYLECLSLKPDLNHPDFDAADCLMEFIPDNQKTIDLCHAAVTSNPYDFKWIPVKHHNAEICRLFLVGANELDVVRVEELLPSEVVTPVLCRTAIDLGMIGAVAYNLKDEQLWFYAVNRDPMNLEYIDHKDQSLHLCRAPHARNPNCAQFIRSDILEQLI